MWQIPTVKMTRAVLTFRPWSGISRKVTVSTWPGWGLLNGNDQIVCGSVETEVLVPRLAPIRVGCVHQ